MLYDDMNITGGEPFRNRSETHGALVEMRSALDGIPNIGGFIEDIRTLNNSMNAMSVSKDLATSIRTLSDTLNAIPDLSGIINSLQVAIAITITIAIAIVLTIAITVTSPSSSPLPTRPTPSPSLHATTPCHHSMPSLHAITPYHHHLR